MDGIYICSLKNIISVSYFFYDARRPWKKIGYEELFAIIHIIGHDREEMLEVVIDIDMICQSCLYKAMGYLPTITIEGSKDIFHFEYSIIQNENIRFAYNVFHGYIAFLNSARQLKTKPEYIPLT